MEHILMRARIDCSCAGYEIDDDHKECPVCEWGAGICKVCGAAEGQLMDMCECPGEGVQWRDADGDILPAFYNPIEQRRLMNPGIGK
jgi:hypothetical protein